MARTMVPCPPAGPRRRIGRRMLLSQAGVEPKWATSATNSRIGSLTTLRPGVHHPKQQHRGADHTHSHKHLGYVAVVGIAVGMVALVCFYLCVWLLRQGRQQPQPQSQSQRQGGNGGGGGRPAVALLPRSDPRDRVGSASSGSDEDDRSTSSEEEVVKRGLSGDGESMKQTWSSECVELVLMAGEHVPTFVAHPQANVH